MRVLGRRSDAVTLASGQTYQMSVFEQVACERAKAFSHFMVVGEGRPEMGALFTLKVENDEKTGLPTNRIRPEAREWMKDNWQVAKI